MLDLELAFRHCEVGGDTTALTSALAYISTIRGAKDISNTVFPISPGFPSRNVEDSKIGCIPKYFGRIYHRHDI